jgi:NAD(P)-dependent dehydrogenase (short-subunit alcohol dehydrogenase family)
MGLEGRVAIVTGASRGIGRAIALRLAREGANLGLIDVSDALAQTADEIVALGREALAVQADVGDAAQVRAAVASIRERLGAIDCLVNNAGITNNIAALERMRDDAWQKELSVNLTGPFNLLREVLPGMAAQRWGRIVNVSSMAGRGGLFNQAGYAATKAGVLGLTRNVTLEYARHGIACNAILPGLIETQAVAAMPQVIREQALALTPARRTGTPDEVAALVAFLCSEEAGFVNGAEIDIDGGSRLCQVVLGSMREVNARRDALGPAGDR